MKTTLNTRTLEAALRDAQSHGYRTLFDPMTTLHSDIGEFITQLSNQDAPFLKGAVKEPNVHSQPHYNFISSKPMKEKRV